MIYAFIIAGIAIMIATVKLARFIDKAPKRYKNAKWPRPVKCTRPTGREPRIMRHTCSGIEPHFQQKYIRKTR